MKKVLFLLLMLTVLSSCNDDVQKSYWDNGKLKSELRYADGKLNGECVWYYPNGQQWMRVNYVDDIKDGVVLTYAENGKLTAEEYYTGGKLNGPFKKWYDNGQLFQDGQYADMMDGLWLIFYPEGQLSARAQFDKGRGKQIGYSEEGIIMVEINYLDNQKHGQEIHYAPDGTILEIIDYENGRKILDTIEK